VKKIFNPKKQQAKRFNNNNKHFGFAGNVSGGKKVFLLDVCPLPRSLDEMRPWMSIFEGHIAEYALADKERCSRGSKETFCGRPPTESSKE